MQKIPLNKCKLWWPAWQQGIPFTSYGYTREVTGEGYRFTVDPEMDSWLCENGELMPICSSTLVLCQDGADVEIKWTSFTILPGGYVQVNYRAQGHEGYHVDKFPVEQIAFAGETCSLDE